MNIEKASTPVPQSAEAPSRREYKKPELIVWGSLRDLTLGPIEGLDSDQDFTGSQGV